MLPQAKIEEVEKLLAEGKYSQRKISQLTGICRAVVSQVAAGERPDYSLRSEPDADRLEPTGDIERCPTCGAKVYMPCRLCHLQSTAEQDTLNRYRRRAKQKASRRLLAAVVRRQQVAQALVTEASESVSADSDATRTDDRPEECA